MPKDLLQPILTDGSRHIHYFNGRVLTADDLKVEQESLRRRDDRLGRALGSGVVQGMEVARANTKQPAVTISSGSAINAEGQVLELKQTVTVNVVPEGPSGSGDDALFVPCPIASSGTAIPVGTGAYILLAAPAAGSYGLAPRVGFADDGVARSCDTRFVKEGVQFRLVELDLESDALVPDAIADTLRELASIPNPTVSDHSKLRNLIAHWCLGTIEIAAFPIAHFGGTAPPDSYRYGPLDVMRNLDSENANRISSCEVPLALLFWQNATIAFVDRWAVRRRPMAPASSEPWSPHVGVRRIAEAEAAFLQFQEQLEEAQAEVSISDVSADSIAAFLPAGGYVPAVKGDPGDFFSVFEAYTDVLDEALVRQLLFASFLEEPIDLLGDKPRPPLVLYQHDDYVIFRRGTERVAQEETEPEEEPPTETTPKKGTIDVVITGTKETLRKFLEEHKKGKAKLEVKNRETGARPPLKLIQDAGFRTDRSFFDVLTFGGFGKTPRVQFTTGKIPVGTYRVSLKRKSNKRVQDVELATSETETVVFDLQPPVTYDPPFRQPPIDYPVGDEFLDLFEKYIIVHEYLQPKWPPPEPEPRPWWKSLDPYVNPDPGFRAWSESWGVWLQKQDPDVPVDPEAPRIFVDPTHDPEEIADAPYAYLAFGNQGAFAPILLTPKARTLERDVPTDGTLLEEGMLASRISDSTLGNIDSVAAAWSGLIAETLGVSVSTAADFISDARTTVDDRKGSLRVFSGVDAALEKTLTDAGITDAVALANTTVDALVTATGLSRTHALLLLDQARSVVPSAAWNLKAAQIGLGTDAIETLISDGISTVGQFTIEAGDATGRARILGLLGIRDERLDAAKVAAEKSYTDARRDLMGSAAKAPITRVEVVDADTASRLGKVGIRTVADLAMADRTTVVEAIGDVAADSAIGRAREIMPLSTMEEVSPESARLLSRRGVRTVGELAAADPLIIARDFGGDASVANAVVDGAKNRLRGV